MLFNKGNISTARVVGSALLVVLLLCVSEGLAQTWGRIEIPARGLLDFEEGTVEAWVLFDFDPEQREESSWRTMGTWFNLVVPKSEIDLGARMGVSVGLKKTSGNAQRESSCLMRVGFDIDGKEVPYPVLPDCTQFGQKEWHHVAVTWQEGRYLKVFFDGKQVASSDFPWSIVRDIPAGARVILGNAGYVARNLLWIDEVRISSIARSPEDLGYFSAPLKPDPFTLFLESFEEIRISGDRAFTRPAVVANVESPKSYEIIGGGITPGKVGNGFCFNGAHEELSLVPGVTREEPMISAPKRLQFGETASPHFSAESYLKPMVAIPVLFDVPIVDGSVGRREWGSAAKLAPSLTLSDGILSEPATLTLIGYTADALYIGFKFRHSSGDPAADDGSPQFSGNDSIQLVLRPGSGTGEACYLKATLKGVQEKGLAIGEMDRPWVCDCDYAARQTEDGWEGEMVIPFQCLNVDRPKSGDVWSLSLVRMAPALKQQNTSWAYSQNFEESLGAGEVVFQDSALSVRVLEAGEISRSEVGSLLEVSNFRLEDATVEAGMILYKATSDDERYFDETDPTASGELLPGDRNLDGNGERFVEKKLMGYAVARRKQFTITIPAQQTRRIAFAHESASGNYVLHYEVGGQGTPAILASGPLPFVDRPSLEVTLNPYILSGGVLEVVADYHKMPGIQGEDRIGLYLVDNEKKVLLEVDIPADTARRQTVSDLSVSGLLPGRYTVRCVLKNADGAEKAVCEVPWTLAPLPSWWGNTFGYPEVTDTVPEPWTPMLKTDGGFEVWNRAVVLANALQPAQIRNGAAEMLSRPALLAMGLEGLSYSALEVTSVRKTGISYRQKVTAEGLDGEIVMDAEFDGFMKYSLRLAPRGTARLTELALEFPLRAELCTHYHHGSLGTPLDSRKIDVRKGYGEIGEAGLSLPFTHEIWLGGEEMGFQWVAESDQWWAPEDPQKAVVVRCTDDEALLRINLVALPIELTEPVRYEWAITPTPVKPMNADFLHRLRLAQSGLSFDESLNRLDEQTGLYLDALVDGGANAFCQWAWQNENSIWNEDFGAPGYRPSEQNQLRKASLREAVDLAHQKGIRWFILYAIWSCFSDWPDVGELWKEQALQPVVPSQDGYSYCAKKPFADWYIATLRKTAEELDIDGVYLDSSADPLPCANFHHGCGYIDKAGKVHATYPVFATRELHKRIYFLFHGEIKKGGLVYAHNSHYPFPAVESFVDVHHCGEGSSLTREWIIPKYYGYPFGVPVSFTRWNSPLYPETRMHSWRFVLQIDSTIKAHPAMVISKKKMPDYQGRGREWYVEKGYDLEGEAVWPVWNAYKEFPWDDSNWIPDWRSEPYAKTNDPEMWVCMHLSKGRAALVVVSSFKDEDALCQLELDWNKMGFSDEGVHITDIMTGQRVEPTVSGIELDVKANLWRMIQILPNQ